MKQIIYNCFKWFCFKPKLPLNYAYGVIGLPRINQSASSMDKC